MLSSVLRESAEWERVLERDGIVLVPSALSREAAVSLAEYLEPRVGAGAGDRSLHEDPRIQQLAVSGVAAKLARKVLGEAKVVRVLYFDKHPEANWKVPYHQDVTIAVRERHETDGFTGWSTKEDMPHVRAPGEVLAKMVAVRLHLDACGTENGPLRAIPGSHLLGRISKEEAQELVARDAEVEYTSPLGGAILMRLLTLHASSQAASPSQRRVLHIEYAACDLPSPLEWYLGWNVE